ncbi:MAG: Reverse gyrase [Firmicutes bacterium]|nr:Reverse gyrase [candidate division NPL-UPA2 bacterium]
MADSQFFSHSENTVGKKEPVFDHLTAVAKLAGEFASVWGRREEAEVAALMHDIGKYTCLFQKVLRREEVLVDHATPGALAILKKYRNRGIAAAIAVQGHHEGLPSGAPRDLSASVKMTSEKSPSGRTSSSRDVDILLQRLIDDGATLPALPKPSYPSDHGGIADMLYVRMLFSALTDADFLATEAHFNGTREGMVYRTRGSTLNAQAYLPKLLKHRDKLNETSTASPAVQNMRRGLFEACISAGRLPKGTFTLTAPTGAGKTLSTLAFALQHAAQHGLRRLIVVLPFLSIVEQTSRVYREALGSEEGVILEDHSLKEHDGEGRGRLLAENWDAPIVVTTTVKFFDSLFSNRSTACRRLHNIANSVVIFDEAQSMPPDLALPTLATVSELCASYGCSVVFSTATQPAFDALSAGSAQLCKVPWHPVEIVPAALDLFACANRVKVNWVAVPLSNVAVAAQIVQQSQALAIVNTRRQARDLFAAVKGSGPSDSYFHLSTDMCPAHRLDSLTIIKERLSQRSPCRLISTQCIEAGVDIDFPSVWRALGPLEAIVQAAGRCNRNGRQVQGEVTVFLPEKEAYPTADYEQGAVLVKLLLRQGQLDLDNQALVRAYYQDFFSTTDTVGKNTVLREAITALDFPEVARLYQWIPGRCGTLLVPYLSRSADFESLASEARKHGINKDWQRRARMLSVGVFLRRNSNLYNCIEPIRDRHGHESGWYILLNSALYCPDTGLQEPSEDDARYVV